MKHFYFLIHYGTRWANYNVGTRWTISRITLARQNALPNPPPGDLVMDLQIDIYSILRERQKLDPKIQN